MKMAKDLAETMEEIIESNSSADDQFEGGSDDDQIPQNQNKEQKS